MEKKKRQRILVIEDEQHIADGLKLNLSLQGYEVEIANDGVTGLQQWKAWHPHLIVLDIMLPGIDGLSVLRNIRLDDEKIPILILSAMGTTSDRVTGLKYGVDDYLSKPFDLEEFLLRIERLLARVSMYDQREAATSKRSEKRGRFYTFGENRIDFEKSLTHCRAGLISLTEQEIKLLKLFIRNRGRALSRQKLLEIGWGYTKNMTTRTVDNFMVRFRKYFEENPKKPVFFKSRRSVGYIFDHDLE